MNKIASYKNSDNKKGTNSTIVRIAKIAGQHFTENSWILVNGRCFNVLYVAYRAKGLIHI